VVLSQANVTRAGVTDHATIVRGDIFEYDFSKANVLTMFLLPTINMKLRPKILDMPPGTRIVSVKVLNNKATGTLSQILCGIDWVSANAAEWNIRVANMSLTGSGKNESGGDWPARTRGLSEREAEIVSLITHGLGNDDIADRLFLSINTVKSYIRSAYRKMGVKTRSQAVLWGVDHGFKKPDSRIRAREHTP